MAFEHDLCLDLPMVKKHVQILRIKSLPMIKKHTEYNWDLRVYP